MNKILVMGKFTIEKDHWRVLKAIMKLEKGDDTKFTLVNKPENYILTKEEVEEYVLVVTTQSNPLVLKNVKKVLGDKPLVKPYRNKNKDLRQNVIDLYNQGYSIEQITMELSCSVTEVQLIIDMI